MKKWILLLCVIGILGCVYGQRHLGDVVENPGILQDSLYTDYKTTGDDLETRYLNKEISYADYMRMKQELEDRYKKEADRRNTIIAGE